MLLKRNIISFVLALAMVVSCIPMVYGVETSDEKILLHETFDGNQYKEADKWRLHWQRIENDELIITPGGYPLLNLPTSLMDSTKSYEFSYRIQFPDPIEGQYWSWRCYDPNNNVSFGGAVPGKAFGWKEWVPDYSITAHPEETAKSPANYNTWYTVKVEFCTDSANRYKKHTLLDADGKVLFSNKENVIYAGSEIATAIPNETPVTFSSIYFDNCGSSGNVHIDDVMLKEIDETVVEPPVVEDGVILEETFDGGEYKESNRWALHWQRIENDELIITPGGEPKLNLPTSLMDSTKSYEFSYDIKFVEPSEQGYWSWRCYDTGNTVAFGGAVPGKGFGWKQWVPDYSITSYPDETAKSPANYNTWYTVKIEFCTDSANRYIKHTLLDADGNVLFSKKEDTIYAGESIATEIPNETPINFSNIIFWNCADYGNVHIDNVKLTSLGVLPKLNTEKIIIRDIVGNEYVDLKARITPGVKDIVLDFRATLDEESAAEGILLAECDENGNETVVSTSRNVDGAIYTISPDDMLKPNTRYIIRASKSVMTESGINLPSSYYIEFTTADNSYAIEADGLYDGDTKITSLNDLTANDSVVIKTKAMNTTTVEKKVIVSISYFNGNKMEETNAFVSTIDAKSGKIIENSVQVPSNIADYNKVQIVCWDTATDMLPYCNAVTLNTGE